MTAEQRADAIVERYERRCLAMGGKYDDPEQGSVGQLRAEIEDAIIAAVAQERERCAAVVESMADAYAPSGVQHNIRFVAERIRAAVGTPPG